MQFPPESAIDAIKSIAQRFSFSPEHAQYDEECMSERGEKRKVEFIESYWTGGELGSDYIWSDNHGELVRCRDCVSCSFAENRVPAEQGYVCEKLGKDVARDWFCADGERRDDDA